MITRRTEAQVMGIVGFHVISHHPSPQQAGRGKGDRGAGGKGDRGAAGREVRCLQKEGSEEGR